MANLKNIHERIMGLNVQSFLKLDTAELCRLMDAPEPEDRKRLNYIMDQAQLENKVRAIVRDELAGLGETKKRLVLEAVQKRLGLNIRERSGRKN